MQAEHTDWRNITGSECPGHQPDVAALLVGSQGAVRIQSETRNVIGWRAKPRPVQFGSAPRAVVGAG